MVQRSVAQPVELDRLVALPRIDILERGEAHRWQLRTAYNGVRRPELRSPDPGFSSPLGRRALAVGAGHVRALTPLLTFEANAGVTWEGTSWERAHPDVPTPVAQVRTVLPGSPGLFDYRNRGRAIQGIVNLGGAAAGHLWKTGAGLLGRSVGGHLTAGRDGLVPFATALEFASDFPLGFSAIIVSVS